MAEPAQADGSTRAGTGGRRRLLNPHTEPLSPRHPGTGAPLPGEESAFRSRPSTSGEPEQEGTEPPPAAILPPQGSGRRALGTARAVAPRAGGPDAP